MKLFGAIDLHSNNNVTVLINEKDEVVYRKRLPNDLKLILGQLAPHQSEIEGIVVESTYNWYWLVQVSQVGAWDWADSIADHYAGDRRHPQIFYGGQLRFVLPVCGQPETFQRQTQRQRQHQERE